MSKVNSSINPINELIEAITSGSISKDEKEELTTDLKKKFKYANSEVLLQVEDDIWSRLNEVEKIENGYKYQILEEILFYLKQHISSSLRND